MTDDRRRPFVLRWRSAVLNSDIAASHKLTLLGLAEFADATGGDCCPGVEKLAKLSSQNEKTCRRALDATADRWFARKPIRFEGREWRGYSYQLLLPNAVDTVPAPNRQAADTVPAPNRQAADTVPARQSASSGHSSIEVRTLAPEAAGTVSDALGRAPRKSTKGRARAQETTFKEWIQSVGEDEEKAVPPGDPVFKFAEEAGISIEFLYLAWRWFSQRYRDEDKTYRDWRAVFRRAIREDWHRCWRHDAASGDYVLTTIGLQMQRQLAAEEEREEAA